MGFVHPAKGVVFSGLVAFLCSLYISPQEWFLVDWWCFCGLCPFRDRSVFFSELVAFFCPFRHKSGLVAFLWTLSTPTQEVFFVDW